MEVQEEKHRRLGKGGAKGEVSLCTSCSCRKGGAGGVVVEVHEKGCMRGGAGGEVQEVQEYLGRWG